MAEVNTSLFGELRREELVRLFERAVAAVIETDANSSEHKSLVDHRDALRAEVLRRLDSKSPPAETPP